MSPKEVAMSTELQSKSTLVIYATVRAIRFARKAMRCLTQGWIQWDRKQLEKKNSSFYSFKYLNENNSHSPDCGDDCFRPSFFHAVNVLEENSQYQRTEAKRLSVVSDNSSQTISACSEKKKKKNQLDFSSKADWTTTPTKMSMRANEKMKMLITVRTAQNLGITSAIPFSSMAKTTGTGLTTQMAMR